MPVCVQAQRSRVVPAPPQDELRGQHSGIGGQCSLGPGLVLGAGGGPPQSALGISVLLTLCLLFPLGNVI